MKGISSNISQIWNLQVLIAELSIGVSYLSEIPYEALFPYHISHNFIYEAIDTLSIHLQVETWWEPYIATDIIHVHNEHNNNKNTKETKTI